MAVLQTLLMIANLVHLSYALSRLINSWFSKDHGTIIQVKQGSGYTGLFKTKDHGAITQVK